MFAEVVGKDFCFSSRTSILLFHQFIYHKDLERYEPRVFILKS